MIYQSRDETESLYSPDLYSSTRCIISYINGLEPSSLYTCSTSWHSVHYMILNKPLVRLTTAHYQSTVSMISFAQVLTAQWSNTIPCCNVWFQVGITSHNIPFQQYLCALVHWISHTTDTLSDITGMHVIEPDCLPDGQPVTAVVHLNTVFRAAHLLPIFSDHPALSKHQHHEETLDLFLEFYVNRYIDCHVFEVVVWKILQIYSI